jgi:hypothetical protein
MKIDLNNNYEVFIQQQQQDRAIHRWCLRRGIPVDLAVNHPQFDDILFLVNFYDEFELELRRNKRLKGIFDAYWGVVYTNKLALKPKAFNKFEQLALDCLNIRAEQQANIERIQALRGTSQNQSVDHNYQANGSYSPQSHIRPGNHEGSAAEG